MNRDERRTRLEGPLHRDNTHCYPPDQVGGGTWCGINQHGLIFCLLNRYDAPVSVDDSIVSRGGIIPTLLACTEISEVRSRIKLLNLVRYNGFRLLVLSASGCDQHDWDRAEYSVSQKHLDTFHRYTCMNHRLPRTSPYLWCERVRTRKASVSSSCKMKMSL